MELIYEGVDITGKVQIAGAKHADYSDGRADSLDLLLDKAQAWYKWQPQPNDRIQLTHNGFTTGELYINSIAPERDRYRILATAAKNAARQKKWASFENKTIEAIAALSAAENGMGYRIYGIDKNALYAYALRRDESAAAFLSRIAYWEGAVLKTYSGKYTMIGIAEAQKLDPIETISISTNQDGVSYERRENAVLGYLRVVTPYADVTVHDKRIANNMGRTICELPAKDKATAYRWARGILLSINRKAEVLRIESELHQKWSAMLRVDVTGETDASGKWMIHEVEHDYVNNTSRAELVRCVESVE